MFFILILIAIIFSGCTNGKVSVSSLGQKLESVVISQGHNENDFLEINPTTYSLNLKFHCLEKYTRLQMRSPSSTDWTELGNMSCSDADKVFSYDLQNLNFKLNSGIENYFDFRFVSEKGYSEPVTKQLVLSQYKTGTAVIHFIDYSGKINTLAAQIRASAKFTYKNTQEHNADEVYLTETAGCLSGGQWQTLSNTLPWNLTKTNQQNTVYAKFRNAAEIESECVQTMTVHDSVPPTAGSLSFIGFPSANLTNTSDFSINISASGDVAEMLVSTDGICMNGNWEPYNIQRLNIPVNSFNSLNFVSIKFRDQARNESSCLTQSFTHDNLPPPTPIMNLVSGSGMNPSQITAPVFQITNVNIGDTVSIFGDSSCGAPLQVFTVVSSNYFYNPTLTADGTYPYYVSVQDLALNALNCVGPLYNYKLDRLPPVITGVGHPTTISNMPNWTETLNGSSDINEFKYKIGTSASTICSEKNVGYSAWTAYTTGQQLALNISSLADGSVTLCFYGRDNAQNEQTSPTTYTWTKNTSSLKAEFVTTTLPNITTNISNLNVEVTGVFITDYKYKVGISTSTDCTLASDYSAYTPIATKITASLTSYVTGSVLKLCVIGKNSSNAQEQPLSLETSYIFTRDITPPIVSSIDFPPPGDYLVGDDLIIGVNFNKKVNIDPTNATRTMAIKLNGGSVSKTAVYYRKVSDTKLEFIYKIISGDAGNFGFNNTVGLPTTGFIYDESGNFLNSASSNVTANLTNNSVMVKNENPVLNLATNGTDTFNESTDTISFSVELAAAITTDIQFKYYIEIYKSDGSVDLKLNNTDTLPAGQVRKVISISGINNTSADGLRNVVIDLRSVNHGSIGTKFIKGAIRDDESFNDGNIVDYAIGSTSGCFVSTNGSVYCFGSSNQGAIGNNTANDTQAKPIKLTSFTGITGIFTSGIDNYCAKKNDGSIWCWGANSNGQIGNGNTATQTFPYKLQNVGLNPDLVSFEKEDVICTKDSVVGTKCQGSNSFYYGSYLGRLGGGNTSVSYISAATPVLGSIENMMKTKLVDTYIASIGSTYGKCVLIDDGDLSNGSPVYCWGQKYANGFSDTLDYSSPQLLSDFVIDIFYVDHGLCIYGDFDSNSANGYEVKCWGGYNNNSTYTYVLGSSTGANIFIPSSISGLEGTLKVVGGSRFACGIGDYDTGTSGYEIRCWGYNGSGQLGIGNTTSLTAPNQNLNVIINDLNDLKISSNTSCAKKTDGSLWCWGSGFTTSPTQQAASDVSDFYISTDGTGSVWIINSAGGLTCKGTSCANYIYSSALPSSGVNQIKSNGIHLCFLQSGSLKCYSYGDTKNRLGYGKILTADSNSLIYNSSEITNITDLGNLCFDFGTGKYTCRSSSQYSLGFPSSASFSSVIESKFPTSFSAPFFSYSDSSMQHDALGNLLYNYYSGSAMNTYGVGKDFDTYSPSGNSTSNSSNFIGNASGRYKTTVGAVQAIKFSENVQPVAGTINFGSYHQCFINSDLTVRCFATRCSTGSQYGQLGNDDPDPLSCQTNSSVTVKYGSGNLNDISSVFTAGTRTCALSQDQSLYCWGQYTGALNSQSNSANLIGANVRKLKMDRSGNIYILKSDNKLSKALWGSISFSEISSNVQDFWASTEGICVKKYGDSNYYCFPHSSSSDLSIFGRFFDILSPVVY